jgi:hypothetical protein
MAFSYWCSELGAGSAEMKSNGLTPRTPSHRGARHRQRRHRLHAIERCTDVPRTISQRTSSQPDNLTSSTNNGNAFKTTKQNVRHKSILS